MPRVQPIRHLRAHDYGHLIRRWRPVARAHGLRLMPFASAGGYELYCVEPRRPHPARPWIYLSAGIHGDEVGSTEGCLEWLATTRLAPDDFNLMAFPCLNPWGIVNNMRTDAEGRDLNRTYHDDSVPQTTAHKALLSGRRFDLALALHEDYDANGIYIYEIKGRRPHWAGAMLAAAARHLPIDTRRTIEGRSSRAGIVRRKIDFDQMPLHPEAFTLHCHHAARTFTIETPSEAHLDARVAAHVAVVETAVRLCLDQPPPPQTAIYI
ncbi:MAG: M14 family metallocarboxypeptidase [Terrimicrobiaceae bacterium]|nr:M14 family metallocarboxypeptidase [Terrimicrobiaceae bacterium]